MVVTLPKTNIFAPKNGWLEDEFPIGARPIFRGYVSFREGNRLIRPYFLEDHPRTCNWFISMVSKSPNWGYSPSKWHFHGLQMGGY